MWVRGLKLTKEDRFVCFRWSHPMWVRGLKLAIILLKLIPLKGRTPCGCVD